MEDEECDLVEGSDTVNTWVVAFSFVAGRALNLIFF
jgi:hypothetical protein